ncbi:MAG: sigma-70 family RNA polymerase sigma factor [Pseudomonadota bacterium]
MDTTKHQRLAGGETPSPQRQELATRTEPQRTIDSELSSLGALHRDHFAALTQYLRRQFGPGPPEPDDIAQQAFQQLAEYPKLESIRDLRAFLWRTARNLVLSEKRNAAVRGRHDQALGHWHTAGQGSDSSPERVLLVEEQVRAIDQALQAMPERRRTAFVWHRVDGLTATEIARRFGITRAAAMKHVAKAAFEIDTALRQLMGGDSDDTGDV